MIQLYTLEHSCLRFQFCKYHCEVTRLFLHPFLPSSVNIHPRTLLQTLSYPDMPPPSCIQSSARNVVTGLLDSNQPSPVSSGVGAQATQTLLGRSAQMAYHYTIRPLPKYWDSVKVSKSVFQVRLYQALAGD